MFSFDDLRARYMAFSKRERVLIGIAAAMLAIVVLWLALRGGGETETEERVELTEAVQAAPAPVWPDAPAAIAAPAPSSLYPAPPPATPVGAVPIGALQLRGVLSGAAIISVADGPQRTVRVGREAAPGMVLKEVGVRHAVFGGPGGDQRLELLPAAPATAGIAPAQ